MINAVNIAQSGMSANQSMLDVISNNIANLQTPAFKKQNVNFIDMIYQGKDVGAVNGHGADNADTTINTNFHGVSISSIQNDISPGQSKLTGRPLDIAIQGKGFLRVELDKVDGYTRVGQLAVDKSGYLTTIYGNKLSDNIAVPPDASQLIIKPDGVVIVTLGQDPEFIEIGQIELASFTNSDALEAVGNGVYVASEDAGSQLVGLPGEEGRGVLIQGAIEQSNVNLVSEMTDLMMAQRGYQLNARVLQAVDQISETINNLIR